jgi:hypothetical protein
MTNGSGLFGISGNEIIGPIRPAGEIGPTRLLAYQLPQAERAAHTLSTLTFLEITTIPQTKGHTTNLTLLMGRLFSLLLAPGAELLATPTPTMEMVLFEFTRITI